MLMVDLDCGWEMEQETEDVDEQVGIERVGNMVQVEQAEE